MKITDTDLATLKCPAGRKDMLVFDDAEAGFGVRETADGKRVLIFQYHFGKLVRRHRIGVWGQGGLAELDAGFIRFRINFGFWAGSIRCFPSFPNVHTSRSSGNIS